MSCLTILGDSVLKGVTLGEKGYFINRAPEIKFSEDTGIGNPRLATAEKGRRFAEAVAQKYALLLKELAAVNDEQDFYEKVKN
jgi:creatinine amidohydrolase/Fe(II)-dependent formamide hydrolase-like protein